MNEQKQLVSVVIPLYNAEKYIKETIQSILNQTYKKLEIIVVDDGSKDGSATLVKQLQEQYPTSIRYIYQQNQGVSAARNNGIEHAIGEYVAFLDSDDLWHETKIEKQMQSIRATNMDACYCGYINFYEETGAKEKHVTTFKQGDITDAFLTHQVLAQTSTWVIKRSILMDHHIRFTPGCSWGEDLEFFFKVMTVTNVCYVDDYLIYYRILSEGNLSSKYKDYMLKTSKEIEVFSRMRDWIFTKSQDFINPHSEQLLRLIDTYILPYTVINNACIYLKGNVILDKEQLSIIKHDIQTYCKTLYFQNGKRSWKLYAMLWYVRLKTLSA
jgi:glycosyltransferase involved in cell wall biosynthesis